MLTKIKQYILFLQRIKMAIIITDECINCGACEAECPNTAIYEGQENGITVKELILKEMLYYPMVKKLTLI